MLDLTYFFAGAPTLHCQQVRGRYRLPACLSRARFKADSTTLWQASIPCSRRCIWFVSGSKRRQVHFWWHQD